MLDASDVAVLVTQAKQAHFRDARLRKRLSLMTEKLAVAPSKSFPETFDEAELEGAYRFFGNRAVTPDLILSGHFDHTRHACGDERTVLVIHDSTTCDFDPDGEREGLGRVRSSGQAFFAHASLVLSDDGCRRPLGLAALATWIRAEPRPGSEKGRWIEGVECAAERLGGSCHVVHVMDREADDYGLFAQLLGGEHHFIVRLAHHGRLLSETIPDGPRNVSEAAERIQCAVQREARLSKRNDGNRSPKQKAIHPSRGQRQATLSIGAHSIVLKRPTTQSKTLPASLTLNVVRVWEADPPAGEAPIEWLLITDEPIDSTEAVLRIVERYRARWTIEEFFKALKTGCAFPERQLGDYEGLVNALAVLIPIAIRLLALRTRVRHDPDAPATLLLENDETEVLRVLGRRPLPPAPSARDVLLAVAALGGHSKWAPAPGWQTLGRGFAKLADLTLGWRAAKLRTEYDQR
jgi:Transposase DNA-binding